MAGINSSKQRGEKDHLAETSKSADTDLLNDNLSRASPAGSATLLDIMLMTHGHTDVLKMDEDESALQKQPGCLACFTLFAKEISSLNLPFTALLRGSRSPPVTDLV